MSVNTDERPLGRLEPETRTHEAVWSLGDVLPATVDVVERLNRVPGWRSSHDQGREGSCVGHAVAMERAITNRAQLVAAGVRQTVRYDPLDIWNEAKRVDYWDWTNPGDTHGTSVDAGYKVARDRGLCPVRSMRVVDGAPQVVGAEPPTPLAGVSAYRWARTVDEMRTAIALGSSIAIGVNWHRGFDSPVKRSSGYWLPTPAEGLGGVRGGHAVCLSGASDRRQAFRLVNSWGVAYPLAWMPYATMQTLLDAGGEAAVVTDR